MNVLIFEPSFGGHRLHYVRHLVEAMAPLTDRLIVVTNDRAEQQPVFQELLTPLRDRFELDASAKMPGGSFLARARGKTVDLRRALKRHRPDRYYVPFADGMRYWVGWRGRLPGGVYRSAPSEALIMRGGDGYLPPEQQPARARGIAFRLLKQTPWSVLHLLDPLEYQFIQRHAPDLAARSQLMPEPVEPMPTIDKAAARRELGIETGGRLIAMAGQMDQRKGADLLIRAWARADAAADDRLLLAGGMSDPVRAVMDQHRELARSGRLIAWDRFISEREFGLVFAAADVVAATYPRHTGSSGIVVRAAAMGRPLVASDYGWIGHTVERFGMGRTLDVTDIDRLAAAMTAALDGAEAFEPTEATRRFNAFHTVENFAATWTAGLREAVGAAPASNLRTWEWVCQALR